MKSTTIKKVLVVDDETDFVETLKFSLECEGIACVAAYNGREALSAVNEDKPDLILLDVMLPEINGFQVCRQLKEDLSFKHIPVLLITARTGEKDVKTGLGTGADEYITKPFHIDDLVDLVKKYLNKQQ